MMIVNDFIYKYMNGILFYWVYQQTLYRVSKKPIGVEMKWNKNSLVKLIL